MTSRKRNPTLRAVPPAALAAVLLLAGVAGAATAGPTIPAPPNVLIVTIDALRADHLGCYGYAKPTSPEIDRLLARGVRFTDARTVEPLTAPALISMITSLPPDVHGASRNAVKMRKGLDSLTKILASHGYRTAAFVSNWTLRHQLTGLDEHFDVYREILTRHRWYGMIGEEAGAADVDRAVLQWTGRFDRAPDRRPLLLWVHYVDPHAPYLLRDAYASRLGVSRWWPGKAERYDTEIANADHYLGRLVDQLTAPGALGPDTLVVFAADHGESLGEHRYWGHGRNLFEQTVRIPLGVVWPGHLTPQVLNAPASILDVAPTVLGLLGIEPPEHDRMAGFDWAPVFAGGAAPSQRAIWLQAHEGAALAKRSDQAARRKGLLEVGVVENGSKQVWRLSDHRLFTYDLETDPGEKRDLTPGRVATLPPLLRGYLDEVVARLTALGAPTNKLDPESIAQLKALGYLP